MNSEYEDAELDVCPLQEKERQKKERLLLGKTYGSSNSLLRNTSALGAHLASVPSCGSEEGTSAGADGAASRRGEKLLAAHFRPQRQTVSATGAALISPRSATAFFCHSMIILATVTGALIADITVLPSLYRVDTQYSSFCRRHS